MELILTNQFHDIIPGSSIHEVYEDSRKDYAKIEQIAEQVVDHYLEQSVSEDSQGFTVYNASGWDLDEIVAVPTGKEGVFTDAQGNVLPSQK